jgi:hypothetical protein
VFVTLSPLLLLNTASAGGPARIVWSDGVGVALFAAGLLIEAIADGQKFAFKMDPANKGRFIDSGLWTYSRWAAGAAGAGARFHGSLGGARPPCFRKSIPWPRFHPSSRGDPSRRLPPGPRPGSLCSPAF